MNIAAIFAGGVGKRMNSKEKPKQFLAIHGTPIIIHTLSVFENHPSIDAIVISCVEEWIEYLNSLLVEYHLCKVKKVVPGGKTGQLSIYAALKAAKEISNKAESIVLIHDGVRPLIDYNTISLNLDSVSKYGTAITTVPVKETIMEVDETGNIIYIPPRDRSRLARAPQSFRLDDILAGHELALRDGKIDFVDSCTLMKTYGYSLHLIDGPEENIKITTPEDFYIMRALLDAKENSQIYDIE